MLADDGYLVRANALLASVAAILLAAGLFLRIPVVIPATVVLLGGEYVAILGFETDALDPRAPLVAGALFGVAELAYWSLELRGAVVDEAGTYLRRVALVATLVVGAVALGVGLLALVEFVSAGGPAVDVLGAVAALGALGLLAFAARRTGA
ncbi:MAG TPA: hypothetical protein VM049_07140 [Gaiellaceae bacterium]|nr:hypothetical protein [Gaiellaceae bacterium]